MERGNRTGPLSWGSLWVSRRLLQGSWKCSPEGCHHCVLLCTPASAERLKRGNLRLEGEATLGEGRRSAARLVARGLDCRPESSLGALSPGSRALPLPDQHPGGPTACRREQGKPRDSRGTTGQRVPHGWPRRSAGAGCPHSLASSCLEPGEDVGPLRVIKHVYWFQWSSHHLCLVKAH